MKFTQILAIVITIISAINAWLFWDNQSACLAWVCAMAGWANNCFPNKT